MIAPILALDLASVAGWCVGEPGGVPEHGSIRFASKGASHEAIFADAFKWMTIRCSWWKPCTIVWEAPMSTSFMRGRTTTDVTTLLYGLPAVIGAAAYIKGVYDIRKADTKDVRNHFIGCNPKRAKANTKGHGCNALARVVGDMCPAPSTPYGRALYCRLACPYIKCVTMQRLKALRGHSFAVSGKTMLCKGS